MPENILYYRIATLDDDDEDLVDIGGQNYVLLSSAPLGPGQFAAKISNNFAVPAGRGSRYELFDIHAP